MNLLECALGAIGAGAERKPRLRYSTRQSVPAADGQGEAERREVVVDGPRVYERLSTWPTDLSAKWASSEAPYAYTANSVLAILGRAFDTSIGRPGGPVAARMFSVDALNLLGLSNVARTSVGIRHETNVPVEITLRDGMPSEVRLRGADVPVQSTWSDEVRALVAASSVTLSLTGYGEAVAIDVPGPRSLLSDEEQARVRGLDVA